MQMSAIVPFKVIFLLLSHLSQPRCYIHLRWSCYSLSSCWKITWSALGCSIADAGRIKLSNWVTRWVVRLLGQLIYWCKRGTWFRMSEKVCVTLPAWIAHTTVAWVLVLKSHGHSLGVLLLMQGLFSSLIGWLVRHHWSNNPCSFAFYRPA